MGEGGDERELFRAEQARHVCERLHWGTAMAVVFCSVLALLGVHTYPTVARVHLVVPPALTVVLLVISTLLTRIPALATRPNRIVMPLAIGVSLLIGWAAKVTGGFASPYYYILAVVWIFGSAVLPLPASAFIVDALVGTALTTAMIAFDTASPGPPWLPVHIISSGLLFSALGAVLRERGERRSFLNRLRLDALNQELGANQAQLALLNRELEQRVQRQVEEILKNARDLELVNAQLRERVRERSHELAAAIARMSRDDDGALAAGTVVGGDVEIVRPLGRGGMGAVYLGRHRRTEQLVAVKVLHRTGADMASLQRFVAEAAAAAAITHPGVIRTLHVDVSAHGHLYQIMEFVDGITLQRALGEALFDSGGCARVIASVADALAAAHAAHVIHRDVKPSNIILTSEPPGVRVLDFGISKMLGDVGGGAGLTSTQQTLGTPEFMSPEQVRDSANVSGATDVYSLGLVMFVMLSGNLPFDGCRGAECLTAHLSRAPRDVRDLVPGADDELATLIARCLAKQAHARPTAAALSRALGAIADRLGAPSAENVRPTTRPVDDSPETATLSIRRT